MISKILARGDVFKLLDLSNQQYKTYRLFIYNGEKQRKAAFPHRGEEEENVW